MNKRSGIYCLTCISNGKKYIGQSINLEKRKQSFFRFNNKHYGGQKITAMRKKYNHAEDWNYEILEYCGVDIIDERERYYIALYNTIKVGLNSESGGSLNKIVSEETKKKHQQYTGEKASMYGRKGVLTPTYGRELTDEQKLKISIANKGRKDTLERRQRKGEARRGEGEPWYGKKDIICVYGSISEASRETGINHRSIGRCVNHEPMHITSVGFGWCFL